MGERIQVTEYLGLDLGEDFWFCRQCNHKLISARENYKKGCLVYDRDPMDIHPPLIDEEINFAPDPAWIRILEFYCPKCGTQIETEYLPPGHPITHDLEIDIDRLKERLSNGEYVIKDKRIEVSE
ncbi:MAG: acetone carboxylase subunit gamma [Pseudomonadota bacterium]